MKPATIRTVFTFCTAFAAGAVGYSFANAADTRQSRYTSLEACDLLESEEEGGYARLACPGISGFKLELVEADARDNLFVVDPSGEKLSLQLPSRSGGGFTQLGKKVEWRGSGRADLFRANAMIVRYDVTEDALKPETPTSYLYIISLTDTPCLAEKIPPGKDQNLKARAAADKALSCLPEASN